MLDEDCWQIVALARIAADGVVEAQADLIAAHLATRTLDDMLTFGTWVNFKILEANRANVFTAVEWMYKANGLREVSGDGWEYQRAWLVARGRKDFYAALENPDVLADFFTTFDDFLSGEPIEYAALKAFQREFGRRDPPDEMFFPSVIETWPGAEPESELTPERLLERFPRIAKKFGPPLFVEPAEK